MGGKKRGEMSRKYPVVAPAGVGYTVVGGSHCRLCEAEPKVEYQSADT